MGSLVDAQDRMTNVCLVNGAPGVGKTTLCEKLANGFRGRFVHLSFGELILQHLEAGGVRVDEPQLRREVTALVDASAISHATDALLDLLASSANKGADWILIDSHAVSPDHYGYIARPDGDSYFSRLRYDAIVHLYARGECVLSRGQGSETGRLCETKEEVEMLARLLEGVTLGYSSKCECPAYFVNAEAEPSSVAKTVSDILT
jgi:adenylate kinase